MPIGTQLFEFELGQEFFMNMESSEIRKGNVKVTLSVKHSDDIYHLDFEMKGTVYIPCDRCLDDMEHIVDTTYHLCVKYGEEYSEESDEVLIIPETDSYLNVAYMIYDTVILTIPLKHVHPIGKCNKAMSAQLKKHSARKSSLDDYDSDDGLDDIFDDDDSPLFDGDEESESSREDNNETDPRWDALKKIKR
ncbi:MAG: DUF177 domain-containing protein [Muribaculaceae bacterium]|nr:DUF177 domain-containing protein [Muribaculaceae bacterium]